MSARLAPPAIEPSGHAPSRSPNLWQSVRLREDEDVIVRQSLDLAVSTEDNQTIECRAVKAYVEETLGRCPAHRFCGPCGSSAGTVRIVRNPRVIQKSGSVDGVNPTIHNHPVIG